MSDHRSSTDSGQDLEALLGSFPFPERDWENQASAIEAQLAHAGPTDAALLGAPLPSEPGEPNAPPSATTTPITHSGVRTQSLADMARRSVEQKQATEREMARQSLALAAKRPNALEVQALREVLNSKLPAVPVPVATVNAAPVSPPRVSALPNTVASAEQAGTLPPARRTANTAHNPWPKLGLLAGGVALAAGVLFWLRQPALSPLASAPAAAPASAVSKPVTEPLPSENSAAKLATQAVAPVGVNPETLPQSDPKPAEPAREKPPAAHAPAASASAAAPKAEKIELADEPEKAVASAAHADHALGKVLPPDPALRPADSTGGAVPAKPSSGAVQAALGAVMSGARRCVAGEDTPSSAVVVFGSDGHVQSVSVSGPASGKPSGGCIEAQLARARVQPFAASSFSVSATVRPN